MRFLSHLATALGFVLTLQAGSLAAQDRLTFQQAVALWLEGNDRDSLLQLAIHAAEGHVEARMLLARIEITDRGPSPFRLSLSREDSHALFRAPSTGFFGRSWLSVEAERGNARALALLESQRSEPDPDLISQLFDLGERQAAAHPTRVIALYGDPDEKAALLQSDVLLSELRPFAQYLTSAPEPAAAGLAALRYIAEETPLTVPPADSATRDMAGMLALGYGYGPIDSDNPWRTTVADWLMHSEATRPISELCNAECPEQAAACGVGLLALTGGYYEVIRIDSPLETVIPQTDFLASPRARIMTLRKAGLAQTESGEPIATIDEIAEISSCLSTLIETERQAYE